MRWGETSAPLVVAGKRAVYSAGVVTCLLGTKMRCSVCLTVWLLACQRAAPVPSEGLSAAPTEPLPVETPAPTPIPEETPAEERVVTFGPDEISYGEDGLATISPGAHVRSASYETYVVRTADLERVLGARPDAEVRLTIRITRTETRTHTPEDPRMARPDGGFRDTTHHGEPISVAP